MKKIISSILIILGVGLLLTPYISKTIFKYRLESKKDILDRISLEEIRENEKLEAEYDFDSVRDIEISSMLSGINDFDDKAVIGGITIPDLNVDLPILKGTNDTNLLVGATTMVEEQEMGQGNYPLAGHYMKDKNLLFGSLLDIEKETIVKLNDKETIYVYKIYDTLLVKDTDIHIIDDRMAEERGKPVLSLMTCYYTSKNGKRFFAMGELIDSYPYNSK